MWRNQNTYDDQIYDYFSVSVIYQFNTKLPECQNGKGSMVSYTFNIIHYDKIILHYDKIILQGK